MLSYIKKKAFLRPHLKTAAVILILALVFTMSVPSAAFASSSDKAPAAPKITSLKVSGNTITIKWSKVKGAKLYKVYLRTVTRDWKYWKTVKKTSANKKRYSNTSVYKLKVSKSGKKYLVYKKGAVNRYRLLKTLKGRKYTFRGEYGKKYWFTVRAGNGKKLGKHSRLRYAVTEDMGEGEGGSLWPPEEGETWDYNKEKEYTDALNSGELKESSAAVRKASLALYKELALKDVSQGKNTMVSPVSFLTAMGMLEYGAREETLAEIQSAFGLPADNFGRWFTEWNGLVKLKGKDTLKVADSVWFKDTDKYLRVNDSYMKTAKEIFEADIYGEPFDAGTVKKINDWVNTRTNGMIPSVVNSLPEDTVMALINATCFTGKWTEPYESYQVKQNQDFTREDGTVDKVEMMSSTENRYFENDKVTGTFKYYTKGYKIMFLLPKEGVSLESALKSLDGDELYNLEKSASYRETRLYLPKFSFDYTAPDSIGALRSMGINRVFDLRLANLGNMATYDIPGYNIYVDSIIHKTHITLNEKGTDAAAATVIMERAGGSAYNPEGPKTVRLDRPFIFVISDNATSTPIFMGTVSSVD